MTELTITPKIADKTARFKGTVAAGEHVAVTIKGGAEWLGEDDGANLTLRVLDLVTGRTLAVFPRPQETMEEGEKPDAWSEATEDENDLYCELNLNTTRMVAAARHMLRVPVLFVMGDTGDPRILYFRDRYEIEYWPERIGDTTPYDLDKWPKQIDEWTELVAEFGTRLATAETNISQAEGRVNAAINAIPQTVETAVVQSNFGKADKVVNATGGNLAALNANGNLADSGKKPADFADATEFAGHKDNTDIHIADTERSAWNAKYDKPSSGIPKADLAAAVQTSLGKADTAIQSHQSLDAYVNAAGYDSSAKEIQLKHGSAVVARIDATAFIKDGMVDSVEISGGNLVISFNTDAGVEDIEIPLTDIFNPANYYDKTAADERFVQKETGKGLFSGSYNDLTDKPTIPAPITVDPALSQTSENPVQNKAVAAALYTGFTEWVCDSISEGWEFVKCEWKTVAEVGTGWFVDLKTTPPPPVAPTEISAYISGEPDDAVQLVSSGLVSFSLSRHLITPTKTSQLTNDGAPNGGGTPYATTAQIPDVTGKADKVSGATAGNFASLTAQGNLEDSGVKPSDFASKADLPYALVTPGEWECSDGENHAIVGPIYDGEKYYYYRFDDIVGSSQFFNTESDALAALSLTFDSDPEITATRPSLPGHLLDRAGNLVVVSGDTTLTLPAAVPGYLRDFLVRLEISGSTVPTITFAAPTGETITYETDGDEFPVPDEAGDWLYSFTESCVAHKFAVSLKKVNVVAQGGS